MTTDELKSLGFEKTIKNTWIGWDDYYYTKPLNPEYGYFLHVTVHVPKKLESTRLEDKLYLIIIHRYFDPEEPDISCWLENRESERLYKGQIDSIDSLIHLLNWLGITS